jgi:hypothetical protein
MTELAAHLAIRHAMTVAMEVRRAFELETREGGRLYVRDEWGRELDWGRVREWEPPGGVGLEMHGAAGRALCESLAAEDGWAEVLGEFERAAAAMT